MSLDLLFDTHSFTWWADESAKLSFVAVRFSFALR